MRRIITTLLLASAGLGAASTAEAAQGCGPGFHRGPYGHCRPNGPPVGRERLAVGTFYPGRGYWDGRRY